MNETNLQIVVDLKDEASSAFKKVGDNISKTGDQMGSRMKSLRKEASALSKVFAGAAVAGGAALGAFLFSAAKGAAEAQVQMAKFKAIMDTTSGSTKKIREELLKASQAAVKFGFDDEAAAESLARLFQRTKSAAQAQQHFALVMDLARAKNIDLASATDLVGQVLSGNGRVLKQYGIEIGDSMTPLQALGKLHQAVANQAGEFASTFPGQLAILSESWSNMKDQIGAVLLDALSPFIKQFTEWLMNEETQEKFKVWTENFKNWGEVAIPIMIDSAKLLFDTFMMWYDALVKVETKIIQVIEKMAALKNAMVGGIKQRVNDPNSLSGSFLRGLLGKANGGPVSGGTPYIVGERGPEVFMPNQSGSIIPNHGLGGGWVTVNISGNFYGTDQQTAMKFADSIAKIIGQQLKIKTI